MPKTVDTVRERERGDNSNELSLVNYAQNIAVVIVTIVIAIAGIVIVLNEKENTNSINVNGKSSYKKINKTNHKKDGLYSNENLLYSPSFLCA